MRTLFILIILILGYPSQHISQCLTTVNYYNWSVIGDNDSEWSVEPGDSSVFQAVNVGASAYLSDDTLYNVRVTGTFGSATTNDDDFLGFIMGYRGIAPYKLNLFTWKQTLQNQWPEGYGYWELTDRLIPVDYYLTSPPTSIIIDTNYGVGKGWIDTTEHNFELYYTSSKTTVLVDGDTIFKTQNCNNPGQFGFYNYSQAACRYSNFNFEILADFFIEKDTICLGDSGAFNIFCDEIAPYYYDSIVWDFGDGSTPHTSTNDHSIKYRYPAVGTYDVNLFVRHKNSGCTASFTKQITVENQFNISLGNDTILCPNTSDILLVTTDPGNILSDFAWNTTDTTPTITVDSTGTYFVEVYNQFRCVDRDTMSVIIQAPFSISYDTTDARCFGDSSGSLIVNAPIGNFDYQLNTNAFVTTSGFFSLPANNYNLTIRDSIGCIKDTTFNIGEPPVLDLTLTSTKDERCFDLCDGRATFNATGGTGAYFTFIVGNGINDTASVELCDGSYMAYTADANLCIDSIPFTINSPTPVSISTNDDDICIDGLSTLSANASGGTINTGNDYSYYWDNTGNPQGQMLTNVYPFADTVYSVYAVDDSLCHSDTITLRINIDPVIDFTASITEGCPSFRSLFTPSISNGAVISNCNWIFGNDSLSDACTNNQTTYENVGFYSVTYNATSDKGCFTEIIKTDYIEVYDPPIADFTYTPFPENATVLNPYYNFVNTSFNGNNFLWDMAGIDTISEENPSFLFSELEEKQYQITLHVTSIDGCSDTITKPVVIENKVFIYIPNSFTPNGDGFNDLFKPILNGLDLETYEFSVYTRWGEKVFSTNLQDHSGWDGTKNGELSKSDTYTWRLVGTTRLAFGSNLETNIKKEGIVNLLR